MGELRWVLLAVGLAVLVLVYLYTKQHRDRDDGDGGRLEPVIDGEAAAEADDDAESADGAAAEPGSVSLDPDVVVTVRVTARGRSGFSGEQLVLALRKAGLRHGRFGIFHRHPDEAGRETPLFSVASLVEPGSFDLTTLKTDRFPGVSFFLALPGPRDGVRAFDEMLGTARELALGLQGDLLDDQGSKLSIQRERYMREQIIRYQHQGVR